MLGIICNQFLDAMLNLRSTGEICVIHGYRKGPLDSYKMIRKMCVGLDFVIDFKL